MRTRTSNVQRRTSNLEREVKRDRNGLTRCRVCGCTEVDACAPGCSWVEEDLCSVCAVAAEALFDWLGDARRANKSALWREVERRAAA
jgi:hypothetical protein